MRAIDVENLWQEKSILSKIAEGPERTALLWVFGLLGCIVAGKMICYMHVYIIYISYMIYMSYIQQQQ